MSVVCNLNKIEKVLGNKLVLGPVSLSLFSGEIVGIVGSNGAGKSTLLKVIAGVFPPTAGTVTYAMGADTIVGYVPQDIALYEAMTGRQNLSFWADVYKIPRHEKKQRIVAILNELGLSDKANVAVSTYSGGMKRRLNLGVALLLTPHLLLLDEPTVGADEESNNVILKMIEKVKQSGGTVVFISHHKREIEQICGRIIHLEHGLIADPCPAN